MITDVLDTWTPRDPAQGSLLAEYRAFVAASGAAAVDRSLAPAHLTASCFVLTPDRSRVLLCFHRKGQFWVQLGGHLEPGDASLSAAAHREAREEGGIDLIPGSPLPADVNRHDLSAAFGRCRTHWDVGFVAYASASAVPVVSDESEQVAWFDVHDLPDRTPDDFAARLRTVLAEVGFAPLPPRLETERLILTPEVETDAPWFASLLTARGTGTFTIDDARARIATMATTVETTGIGALVLRRRDDGEPLGYCAIIVGRGTLDEPELAYELLPSAHGQGYATEAALAVLDAAFATGRTRIWSTVRSWNTASLRVLDKLGFRRDRVTADAAGELVWLVREG